MDEFRERGVFTGALGASSTKGSIRKQCRWPGDLRAAEASIRRALDIKRPLLGTQHPETAALIGDLAVLLEDQRRPAEACECYTAAATALLAACGPDDPRTKEATSRAEAAYHRHRP